MRAVRKKSQTKSAEQSAGINRLSGITIRNRSRNSAYPEVWGYIRPKQTEHAFECHQCAQKFQNYEELRQHEVDCVSDDASKPW
jgi:hypothetical protein